MSTTVQPCTNCKNNQIEHDFQDRTYGKYNRLHNVSASVGKAENRCTVCGTAVKTK